MMELFRQWKQQLLQFGYDLLGHNLVRIAIIFHPFFVYGSLFGSGGKWDAYWTVIVEGHVLGFWRVFLWLALFPPILSSERRGGLGVK